MINKILKLLNAVPKKEYNDLLHNCIDSRSWLLTNIKNIKTVYKKELEEKNELLETYKQFIEDRKLGNKFAKYIKLNSK